jgi:hypothetical protein
VFISDEQRRARLAIRHGLATPVATVEEAVRSVVCLHATEPASVYLAAAVRARCTREDIDAALFENRSIVKQLAMRRTLFAFPRDLLGAVWGSASARVTAQIGTRFAKDIELGGLTGDGAAWLTEQTAAVKAAIASQPCDTAQMRQAVPELDRRMVLAEGKAYESEVAVANRAITVMAADGSIVRGINQGTWRSSRPLWTLATDWLDEVPPVLNEAQGYRELIGRWLAQFGPGTEDDIVWWLGATKSVVRRALHDLEAIEVGTEAGPAYVLPDDAEPVTDPGPWAALLPVLDPTLMGWKQRDFYLGQHGGELFDRNGNGGTTAWWGGRIVGGWHQSPEGEVIVDLLKDVGAEGRAALESQAQWWNSWLGGEVVGSVYHSPLTRRQMR